MIDNRPNQEVLNMMNTVAESIFGTAKDPEQMSISMDSWDKLQALNENCVLYEQNDGGNLISWIVVMPTTKDLMHKFLNKEINEQQLLDQTKAQDKYSALYLCSGITLPDYRRQGHALKLFLDVIKRMPLTGDYQLFAWPTTPEGKKLADRIFQEIGKTILIRQ